MHLALEPGASGVIEFRATAAGEYKFYCEEPGHREGGMTAVLRVVSGATHRPLMTTDRDDHDTPPLHVRAHRACHFLGRLARRGRWLGRRSGRHPSLFGGLVAGDGQPSITPQIVQAAPSAADSMDDDARLAQRRRS